ncbi:MAG: undecaprenyl-diphosphate phosphatase [Butyrivibrio sp.]|nr:undecaprenyl-diphosphate phosphatase [Muribaculum sp.]MCM1551114.1 undecaprenyl-diphosphate phosphatase [Butyrivibrio sp.]
MFEIIKAIIYGIVEGVTEWLPISSTGHLILVEELIPFTGVSEDFFGMFDVVIQLGAILAVVVLFWNKIWPFALTRKERGEGKGLMSFIKPDIMTLWFKILVSCVPAAVIGVLFDDMFDALFYNPVCVALALIVFGVAFILIENWNAGKGREPKIDSLAHINYQVAFMIGVFQLIAAVFPGTSRSGATIVGALLIGVSRTIAAEYTFFLAIPVMFGASLLKVLKFGFAFTSLELVLLLVGTAVSFVVSLFILRFLMAYIKKHDFKVFGWYRIVLGLVVLAYFGLRA